VRYDPFDIGTAFAYVQGRWVQCRSEQYLQLRGHSERELQIASSELRRRHQNHARDAAITAKRLADLLASAQAHETILLQRLHDLEARDVFARLGGYQMHASGQPAKASEEMPIPSPMMQKPELVSGQITDDENDEDLEGLEEYGEYR
jgi:putative transposase